MSGSGVLTRGKAERSDMSGLGARHVETDLLEPRLGPDKSDWDLTNGKDWIGWTCPDWGPNMSGKSLDNLARVLDMPD
jgi:hypothetical protein